MIKRFLTNIIKTAIESSTIKVEQDILSKVVDDIHTTTINSFANLPVIPCYDTFIVDGRNISRVRFIEAVKHHENKLYNEQITEICRTEISGQKIFVATFIKNDIADNK